MAIPVSPVRLEQHTIRVHKTHETDGIHTTKAQNSSSPVPGRYANNSEIKTARQDTPTTLMQLPLSLGFIINLKKSILSPKQELEFLGFVLNFN
jgi:hypothetical protein